MSAEFAIFSPRTPDEFGAVEAECRTLLDVWLAEHQGAEPPFADFELGGTIPTPEDAKEMVFDPAGGLVASDSPVLAEVLARLARMRSAITIERPDDVDVNPLLVSVLKHLIRGAGEGLVMFVNALDTTEDALRYLAPKADVPDFSGPPEAVAKGEASAGADPSSTTRRSRAAAIDVPNLIVDGLVADGLIALDPDRRRESLTKALDKALVGEHEVSPVKALVEVLFDHDAVAEVFGTDAELEASMRRALQSPKT